MRPGSARNEASDAVAAIHLRGRDGTVRLRQTRPAVRDGDCQDIGDVAAACEFGVFKSTIAEWRPRARLINAKGRDKYSRRILDNDMKNLVGEYGAKGLAYFKVVGGLLESSIAKFFTEEQQRAIVAKLLQPTTATCFCSSPTVGR